MKWIKKIKAIIKKFKFGTVKIYSKGRDKEVLQELLEKLTRSCASINKEVYLPLFQKTYFDNDSNAVLVMNREFLGNADKWEELVRSALEEEGEEEEIKDENKNETYDC